MDKIKFEDSDILERFYQETSILQVEALTDEKFFSLPLNPEYEKNQLKKQEEAIKMLLADENNLLFKDNNEQYKLKQQ